MRILVSLFALFFLLNCGGVSAQSSKFANWREFAPYEGGCKLLFPNKPHENLGYIKVARQEAESFEYSVRTEAEFSLLYFDVPHAVTSDEMAKNLTKEFGEFTIGLLKGKLLQADDVIIETHAGLQLEISLEGGGLARARLFMVGRRLYRLLVQSLATAPDTSEATNKFFSSFALVPLDKSKRGEIDRYLDEQTANPNKPSGLAGKIVQGGIINGKAIKLPRPDYPQEAKANQASGTVSVQVIINEEGKVIAAQAVSGHPLLRGAGEAAARKARFSPTLVGGVPVSVTGTINYNFVPGSIQIFPR